MQYSQTFDKYDIDTYLSDISVKTGYELFSNLYDLVNYRNLEYSNFPKSVRVVLNVMMFYMEINNGGFHQYLANTSGDYAEEMKSLLDEFGAIEILKIFQKTLRIFPDGNIPVERLARNKYLESEEERNEGFDYFDEENREVLKPLEMLFTYFEHFVKDNIRDFIVFK